MLDYYDDFKSFDFLKKDEVINFWREEFLDEKKDYEEAISAYNRAYEISQEVSILLRYEMAKHAL